MISEETVPSTPASLPRASSAAAPSLRCRLISSASTRAVRDDTRVWAERKDSCQCVTCDWAACTCF